MLWFIVPLLGLCSYKLWAHLPWMLSCSPSIRASNQCGKTKCNKLMHLDWCKAFNVRYDDLEILKNQLWSLNGMYKPTNGWRKDNKASNMIVLISFWIHICFLGFSDVCFLLSISFGLFVDVSFQPYAIISLF
jgi:hypothetical protein